jgi:hypothetical protein
VVNVADWPEASFGCVVAIHPESGVKPTYRDRSTDAVDPNRSSAASTSKIGRRFFVHTERRKSGALRAATRLDLHPSHKLVGQIKFPPRSHFGHIAAFLKDERDD